MFLKNDCYYRNRLQKYVFFSAFANKKSPNETLRLFVRMKGVEPPRREALDPKSSMSTNSITSAIFVFGFIPNALMDSKFSWINIFILNFLTKN